MFFMTQLRVPVCFDISRYLTDKYFDIAWGCHTPGDSPKWIPQNQFLLRLNLGCQCFMISAEILQTNIFTLLFWRFHNQMFLNTSWFYGRKKVLLSVTALAMRRSFTGFAGKLPSSCNCNYILSISLPWLGDSKQTFMTSKQTKIMSKVLKRTFQCSAFICLIVKTSL